MATQTAQGFDQQKAIIRGELEKAIRAYQRLIRLDLMEMTRENAAEMYQEFAEIEATFEAVGGILDMIHRALIQAGELLTEHIETIGFAGEPQPLITDVAEEDENLPHPDD